MLILYRSNRKRFWVVTMKMMSKEIKEEVVVFQFHKLIMKTRLITKTKSKVSLSLKKTSRKVSLKKLWAWSSKKKCNLNNLNNLRNLNNNYRRKNVANVVNLLIMVRLLGIYHTLWYRGVVRNLEMTGRVLVGGIPLNHSKK